MCFHRREREREMNVEVQIDQEQKMTVFVSPRPAFGVETREHLLIILNDCKAQLSSALY